MSQRGLMRAVIAEANKVERRFARAIEKALMKTRAGVSGDALIAILASRDRRAGQAAKALVPKEIIRDAQAPLVAIMHDTIIRGGRIAAKDIRGEL